LLDQRRALQTGSVTHDLHFVCHKPIAVGTFLGYGVKNSTCLQVGRQTDQIQSPARHR
jgi:hypothetical protein